jgi:hypothetical protein
MTDLEFLAIVLCVLGWGCLLALLAFGDTRSRGHGYAPHPEDDQDPPPPPGQASAARRTGPAVLPDIRLSDVELALEIRRWRRRELPENNLDDHERAIACRVRTALEHYALLRGMELPR